MSNDNEQKESSETLVKESLDQCVSNLESLATAMKIWVDTYRKRTNLNIAATEAAKAVVVIDIVGLEKFIKADKVLSAQSCKSLSDIKKLTDSLLPTTSYLMTLIEMRSELYKTPLHIDLQDSIYRQPTGKFYYPSSDLIRVLGLVEAPLEERMQYASAEYGMYALFASIPCPSDDKLVAEGKLTDIRCALDNARIYTHKLPSQ